MIYVNEDLYNSNYNYYLNDRVIVVKTNNNCYTSYNTTYCDCYYIFTESDYVVSDVYSCSGSSYHSINIDNISTDYIYRKDYTNAVIISFIIITILFVITTYFFGKLFKWLK